MHALKFLSRPFGFDLFCLGNKFLVMNFVGRNLKLKYRRSFLGFFWTLLLPMATALMYYLVFQVIVRVPIPNYLAFILTGVLPWTFFSQTILEGMESIRSNAALISKIPLPLNVFALVSAMTNFSSLVFALPIILGAILLSGIHLGASIILIPFLFGLLFFLAYGLGLILSVAFVFLLDLRHLMAVLIQVWFYGTPVVYNEAMIPPNYYWILYANPVGALFACFRTILLSGQWPSWDHLVAAIAWSIAVLLLGLLLYRKFDRRLVELI